MSVPYTTTGTAPTGWMCYSCGNWVPNGVTHSCTYIVPPTTVPAARSVGPFSLSLSDADIERIARRVVELLAERSE